MIVASFLCKNLFLPWQWGEKYFSLKLLDYEASSNIGSWQWGASTGADSVPYFRVFNPYSQSEKFDKNNLFINSVLPKNYPTTPIVDIKASRKRAIDIFKQTN
jgi:deoxyribodipyrimidine photo-lyase